MLASGKIVGFVPTKDYDKARAFYEGNLGFEFISLDQYALVMSVGGHKIRIAKVSNFIPLQGTILGWEVENIETIVTWLRDKGVVLEKYPFVQDRELGIWTTPTSERGSKIQIAISFLLVSIINPRCSLRSAPAIVPEHIRPFRCPLR